MPAKQEKMRSIFFAQANIAFMQITSALAGKRLERVASSRWDVTVSKYKSSSCD